MNNYDNLLPEDDAKYSIFHVNVANRNIQQIAGL